MATLRKDERIVFRVGLEEELVIPPECVGKLVVRSVQMGGDYSHVTMIAREDVEYDMDTLVATPAEREFRAYVADVEEFLDYKRVLTERLEG